MKNKKRSRKAETWKAVDQFNASEFPSPSELMEDGKLQFIHFGKHEVEESARLLVRFFEQAGGWKQFSLEELSTFCQKENASAGAALFGLISWWFDDAMFGGWRQSAGSPYVVQYDNTDFAITTAFIKNLKPCRGK